MNRNYRTYGNPPHAVVLVHGGPGAAGGLELVAKELSSGFGVLEPLQTRDTISGQLEELHDVILQSGSKSHILVGHSWGAWLSYLFAAKYPDLVNKLILVGSGPFESHYAKGLMDIRMGRMTRDELRELNTLLIMLSDIKYKDKNTVFQQIGKLMSGADGYAPLPELELKVECRYDIFEKVWSEASRLRASGELLKIGSKIQCPVVAIHGDYDPHPAEGVKKPLSQVIKEFRFILLEKCGHDPWNETHAYEKFYQILKKECVMEG